jgi:hypothetical protein
VSGPLGGIEHFLPQGLFPLGARLRTAEDIMRETGEVWVPTHHVVAAQLMRTVFVAVWRTTTAAGGDVVPLGRRPEVKGQCETSGLLVPAGRDEMHRAVADWLRPHGWRIVGGWERVGESKSGWRAPVTRREPPTQ